MGLNLEIGCVFAVGSARQDKETRIDVGNQSLVENSPIQASMS